MSGRDRYYYYYYLQIEITLTALKHRPTQRKVEHVRCDNLREALEESESSHDAQRPFSDCIYPTPSKKLRKFTKYRMGDQGEIVTFSTYRSADSEAFRNMKKADVRLRSRPNSTEQRQSRDATRKDSTATGDEAIAPCSTSAPDSPEFGTLSGRCRARVRHARRVGVWPSS